MFERDYNLEITVKILLEKYHNEMTNEGAHSRSELKRWYNFWERKLNNVSEEIQGAWETRKRVIGKPGFTLGDPPDSIIEALNFADPDFFPNRRKLLILEINSTIRSTEDERAASGIRRLKIAYQKTMCDKRESDLNLLHLQRISNIDIQSVAQMFIRKYPRKMFKKFVLFEG